jgi:GDP-6-deoxy-D-talose 4-dehydrogenase
MIYIIGSNGFIGQKLNLIFKKKKILNISTKKNKDCIKTNIFNKKCSEKWIKKISSNDIIFFLSSFGNIEYHEKYQKKINDKINNLNNNFFKIVDKNTKIIFFSSDMVYGNTKKLINDDSKPSPLNNYGTTKIKIENLIKKNFDYFLILRLPKIFSKSREDKIFPNNHLLDLKKKKVIRLFKDNLYHYMNIIDLMKIISNKKIFSKNLLGVYNLPTPKNYSRMSFFKKFIGDMKYKKNKYLIKNDLIVNSKIKFPKRLIMKTKFFKEINYKIKLF